jgi:DNA-binding transcriptional LysR family regulator
VCGGKPRGKLRISAPLLFSQTAMGKTGCLEVTTDDRTVDLVEEGYDLVIRVNPDPDESLVGRIFLRDRLVVVASPTLARPSLARPKGDAAAPAVVRGGMGRTSASAVTTPAGKASIAVDPVLSLSSLVMVRDAVRAGVGAALLPISLVSHDLAAGQLVKWGDVEGPDIASWTLYPSRRLLSARVTAFLDHLRESFPQGTPGELAAYI